MSRSILERKNWEVFLVFLAVQFLVLLPITLLSLQFGLAIDSIAFQVLQFFAYSFFYFSYPIFVGIKLNNLLATQKNFRLTTTLIVLMYFSIMTASKIIDLSFEIVKPWRYLIDFIAILCFLALMGWPARAFKSIELRRNAGIWEYIPEAFQFFVWPLGVWWLQPRLNKINENKVIIIQG